MVISFLTCPLIESLINDVYKYLLLSLAIKLITSNRIISKLVIHHQFYIKSLKDRFMYSEKFVKQTGDLFEECEGKSDIQDNSAQSGNSTLVEASDTLILKGLDEAIETILVFFSLKTLHISLNDINRSVSYKLLRY